jgi:hypothetical protein
MHLFSRRPHYIVTLVLVWLLMLASPVLAQEGVVLTIPETVLPVGEPSLLVITADCPPVGCATAGLELSYQSQKVAVQSITVQPHTTTGGATLLVLENSIDNDQGEVHVAYVTELADLAAIDTSQVTFQIQLVALSEGNNIRFDVTTFIAGDSQGGSYDTTVTDGEINASSPTSELLLKADIGLDTQVSVVALNGRELRVDPVPGQTGVYVAQVPAGQPYRTLTVNAPLFVGCVAERDLMVGIPVILLAGDVNDDEIVDLTDAVLIGLNYGTTVGPPLDVNLDGITDVLDLIHVGRNYGQTMRGCLR